MTAMKNTSNAVLEQYLTHVTALFANIERWGADFGLQMERGETTINEERHGQYQAQTLMFVGADTELTQAADLR